MSDAFENQFAKNDIPKIPSSAAAQKLFHFNLRLYRDAATKNQLYSIVCILNFAYYSRLKLILTSSAAKMTADRKGFVFSINVVVTKTNHSGIENYHNS